MDGSISEAEVEAAAKILADAPTIDAPKLPYPCWMGTARAVLEAAEKVRMAEMANEFAKLKQCDLLTDPLIREDRPE